MQDAAEVLCLGDNLYSFAYRHVIFFSFISFLSLDVLITAAVFFPSFNEGSNTWKERKLWSDEWVPGICQALADVLRGSGL